MAILTHPSFSLTLLMLGLQSYTKSSLRSDDYSLASPELYTAAHHQPRILYTVEGRSGAIVSTSFGQTHLPSHQVALHLVHLFHSSCIFNPSIIWFEGDC
uniref:Putative secreted protein n=1 Tax=Anopheles darlingi TaxID=43151 RepID=A0A2M4D9K2_ANODA